MVAQAQLSLDLQATRTDCRPVSERLALPDAELVLFRDFFSTDASDAYFDELCAQTNWKREQIKLYGNVFDVPRLTMWHGDSGKS